MMAILHQTVMDLISPEDEYIEANARRFLRMKWFTMVCDYCGLDPQFARELIRGAHEIKRQRKTH